MDDAALMKTLREVVETNPELAHAIAAEGTRRYPNSPDAAERAMMSVKSLSLQGKLAEARGEAERIGFPVHG